jgi:hypothetical protein
VTQPCPRTQHPLYRDFLFRIVDLELLASRGDAQRLLSQFAALLAAFSFTFAIYFVPRYGLSTLPWEKLSKLGWVDQDLLIATTMAIAGMFTVLAWNNVLPDRRDCLIFGLLPVRTRTIFLAKLAALGTALGVAVAALNIFTGLAYPFAIAAPGSGTLACCKPSARIGPPCSRPAWRSAARCSRCRPSRPTCSAIACS